MIPTMTPRVLLETPDLFAFDKPWGMTVNTSETTVHEQTLQDYLLQTYPYYQAAQSTEETAEFYQRAGIVHRLDKETSGVLLVAKTPAAFVNLQLQFKNRQTEKTYLALVHGNVVPEVGDIRVPVGRLPWDRMKFGVIAGGREAVTHYVCREHYLFSKSKQKEYLSLLEVHPHTGRTHQITVHLKYINHPIFSDFLYAGRKTSRDDRKFLPRVFLHAWKISFLDPTSQKRVTVESPLPSELASYLDTLEKI